MKRLYLMRHGKSDWSVSGQADFDRTLNQRGLRDVPNMIDRLKNSPLPQQIHHSAAIRTTQTANLAAKAISIGQNAVLAHPDLYEAGIGEYLKIIRQIPDTINTVMIVGHNPTITFLVGYLGNQPVAHLPTAAIVCLQFDLNSWKTVDIQTGKLLWYDYPKNDNIPVYL